MENRTMLIKFSLKNLNNKFVNKMNLIENLYF